MGGAFAFLVALVGMGYYASRHTYERGRSEAYKRRTVSLKDRKREIERYCATSDHEDVLRHYVQNGRHYKEISRKFKEDFDFIFPGRGADALDIPRTPTFVRENIFANPSNHDFWVLQLLLAAEGKLGCRFDLYGLEIKSPSSLSVNIRFAQRIEHHLREHGVDIHLVLVKDPHDWVRAKTRITDEFLCTSRFKWSLATGKALGYREWYLNY